MNDSKQKEGARVALADLHDRMRREDEFKALGEAMTRRYEEDERQAERDAQEADFEAMKRRRAEIEREFTDEVAAIAAQRGHVEPDTHDVALAESNVRFRWGAEVDHGAVEEVLTSDPEPVDPLDYRPL